jgi:SAM-dependent methyltransferase
MESDPIGLVKRLRAALKARSNSPQPIVRVTVGAIRRVWHMGLAVVQFGRDESYRSSVLLKLRYRRTVHQTTAKTWVDRYPTLFRASREFLGDHEQLRLLSFGCSTGEEVLTLRRYFPKAQIVGAEINRKSLAQCLTLDVDDRIRFVHSRHATIASHGPYDAIFCLAVLQRTPHLVEANNLASLADVYPFQRFDEQLSELDDLLKPGGLLVVHHTQYVVAHSSIASRYSSLAGVTPMPDSGPRFDARSRRIDGPVDPASVFVKNS